jgi:4-amino-4-deoxy-L-arabinose transferase-like glycosyltransferase
MRNISSSSGHSSDGGRRDVRRTASRRWPPSNRGVWLFLVCLAAYVALFLCTPLPSLQSLTRLEVAEMRLLLPDQYMPGWFGRRGSFMLLDRLPVLGGAAAILAVAWLLGACLLRWGRIDDGLERLERIVFALGAGLNAISLYTLAVGLAGGLHQRWAFFVPAGLLVPLAAWTFWRSSGAQSQPTELPKPDLRGDRKSDWLNPNWMWLGAPFVLAILLGGMLPPVEFDVREYHLEAPKEFYQLGRIEFLPHNVYANMALGSEMFSLLAMALFGDWWLGALVGKTVTAAFAPLTVLALLAAGRRFFTPTIGYVAALIYISTPWIAHVSTSGLVEGASALYWLLAVYAVLLWRQPHFLEPVYDAEGRAKPPDARLSPGPLVLAGWMAGAAVACKYPALLFVVIPLFAWIVWAAGIRGWKAPVVFLLAVVAGCGLWFAKNWVLTGNPTYPLLYEWFGGATRTAAKNAQWTRAHYPQTFALPRLTADLAQIVWRSEWLSPIALPLAVVSLLAAKYRRTALALWGLLAYIVTAWWLMTHRIDRFWVPALPVVALLAGLGAAWSTLPAWRRVVVGLLIVGMAFNLLLIIAPHAGFYNAYFVALEELRQAGWRVGDPWHVYLNHHVPPGWRLLSVGDAQMFDVEPLVLYNTVFDDSILEEICKDRTPEQIHAELLKRRISHIYVHWGEISRYSQPGNYGFPESINRALFNKLVKAGVLESPLHSRLFPQDHPGEVYPVRGVAEANLEMLELSSASEADSR